MLQPQILYTDSHTLVRVHFNRYTDLKKHILHHIKCSDDGEVSVYRSRRGQWGEWYEKWQYVGGKPRIVEEGWN